ncbi:hypothetical protein glysoja_038338 [Glycine soja]|uniref:Uncharacterized protein n=2 Tax=Glycine soja TaxID=3848 RepID=A0A0B2S8S0_GLYSO|nr:hypothetical protein glysoja_038338 [Glycine soja]
MKMKITIYNPIVAHDYPTNVIIYIKHSEGDNIDGVMRVAILGSLEKRMQRDYIDDVIKPPTKNRFVLGQEDRIHLLDPSRTPLYTLPHFSTNPTPNGTVSPLARCTARATTSLLRQSRSNEVVLDAYWTQWVWKIYPLEVEIDKHMMYRFLRIVRFAFLAGSFGCLLDPMGVENLLS